MGAAASEEGCSICGVRGKPQDTPGRPQPQMRPTACKPPLERLGRLASAGGGPLLESARHPCSTPLPPTPGAAPRIDFQPMGSPCPGFGDNSSAGMAEEEAYDRASNCGSMSNYNAELEVLRRGLMKEVKQQQRFETRSHRRPQLGAEAAEAAATRSSLLKGAGNGSIGLNDARMSQRTSLGSQDSKDSSDRVRCRANAEANHWEELSEAQRTDVRYEEMNVGARLDVFMSALRGSKPPRIYSNQPPIKYSNLGGGISGQLRSEHEPAIIRANKVVRSYQDTMKQRLGRIASQDEELQDTVDPAIAVKEGVTRFYETCSKAGTMDFHQLAKNPHVDYALSWEERALIEENVAHLQDRATI